MTIPTDAQDVAATAGGDRIHSSEVAPVVGHTWPEIGLVVAILAGSFLARLLLSGWNSYWLDEIYSVTIYGIWNESMREMLEVLAASVHPPLYQIVLFEWMAVFGDGEAVTRTLSNIYVTGAAGLLYLTLVRPFGKTVALVGTLGFAILGSTMAYGLETRSYGQSMLLAALSSYLLLRLLWKASSTTWRTALLSPTPVLLILANAALLLTHYYNAFFLIAQGVLTLAFVVVQLSPKRWFAASGVMAALFGTPLLIFALVWGRQAIETYQRLSGDFSVADPTQLLGPLELLRVSLVRNNLAIPRPILVVLLVVIAVLTLMAVAGVARRTPLGEERFRSWALIYVLGWLVLPFVVVYLVFATAGVARYSPRYFLFSSVPLLPVLAIGMVSLTSWISRLSRGGGSSATGQKAMSFLLLLGLLVSVLPGNIAAASQRKADWRGIAERIVAIVEGDPDAHFVILETSFRQTPVLNYHLSRYSDTIRVTSTIRRHQEAAGGPFVFESDPEVVEGSDFLIVPFIQHTPPGFPLALERLQSLYEVHLWQLDSGGRGLVIFRTS